MATKKVKGGSAKHNRNKVKCARYRAESRREKNKERRLKKHIKHYPADQCAALALKSVWAKV